MKNNKSINYIRDDMPSVNLFIKFKTTKLDTKHQFVEHTSEIYDCKEYIWSGYLRKGLKFVFCNKEGRTVPVPEVISYKGGPGFTFDDEKTDEELCVMNALVVSDKSNKSIVYNYTRKESYIEYHGKFRKVTLFIRVYDDICGDFNSRWLSVNIK